MLFEGTEESIEVEKKIEKLEMDNRRVDCIANDLDEKIIKIWTIT